jgi:dipeptidyl aminopeptidase/acylaminoacyl peptidase
MISTAKSRVIVCWAVVCAAPVVVVGADDANTAAQSFQRERFTIDGRPAFVIRPAKTVPGPTPWVMYAPTLGNTYPGEAETWMFRRFLSRGIAIAGVDVGESFGSPRGRETYHALHQRLVSKEGFDKRACLLARSRGGLMLYCWAADNPHKVKCIAGIYPVCNLTSYPGLKRACGAYGMTESELAGVLSDHNPVDRLEPLAKARVPIFHIHGNVDKVVPLADNSALVKERYLAAGGSMELMIAKGQGHNMWPGFFECQELVDFVLKHATGQ